MRLGGHIVCHERAIATTAGRSNPTPGQTDVNSTYFALLAEFGEANVPLARVAPKYFGLSFEEARRRAPANDIPRLRREFERR
jgi:hypothetical protein